MLVETELELYLEIVLVLNAKTLLQSPLLANTPLRRLWDLLRFTKDLRHSLSQPCQWLIKPFRLSLEDACGDM